MKILVAGTGSIGKRHIMNMIALGVNAGDIVCVETRPDRVEEVKARFGVTKFYNDLEKAAGEKVDAALICTPTALHTKQALWLAERKIHIFMEKPLASNLDGIDELEKIVKKNRVKVLMAYIFRFAPSVRKVKELVDSGITGRLLYFRGEFSEYLPDWHPWEDYRTFYMAKKSMGGGSILDQSHIIDLAHYLMGEIGQVYCANGHFSDLEVDADDMAEIMALFKSGVNGSIHMDMFGRSHKKDLEIKGVKGNIMWDFYDYSVKLYHGDEKRYETWVFKKDPNEMYISEMKHFLECVKGNKGPEPSLEDGIHTMKVIMASEESSKTRKVVKID